MEVLAAILMIGMGVFMLFIAGAICSDIPAMYGAELVMAGFTAFLCAITGLMCIAVVVEH